ncbi:Disco-interacting protein 2-like A [Acipenser ruthenus]|uniref:Disco-interacting protein 2-like A n=1 Tax=Acipenser ruthenus TaxID=7906 RepID=A0A444TYP0_ACIRT|nr:Disco-interacting protein 2-like A [Acipenser ruthenus]
MAERCSAGFLLMEPTAAMAMTLPAEVREKLAELELELSEASIDAIQTTVASHGHCIDSLERSADDTGDRVQLLCSPQCLGELCVLQRVECGSYENNPSPCCVVSACPGDITQKGYEKKRAKLLAPYIPQIQGVDPSLQIENRIQGSSQPTPAVSKQQKSRASNSRDERFRSDVHTEAVQAALAKYKERKMPMPSKRRSVLVQSSMEACTPPASTLCIPSIALYTASTLCIPSIALYTASTLCIPSIALYTASTLCIPSIALYTASTLCIPSIALYTASTLCIPSIALYTASTLCIPSIAPYTASTLCMPSIALYTASTLCIPSIALYTASTLCIPSIALYTASTLCIPSIALYTASTSPALPYTSSASEDEGSLRRPGPPSVERWFNRVIQGSSTSSSASSTSSHPGGWPLGPASSAATTATVLADLMAQSQIENHSAPPDVTTGLSQRSVHIERPQVASVRGVPRGLHNTTILETADGVPVNSRVSSKIQQLLNTLKRPKRPPLREFFLDDFEELLDVQQPDPNQPKPEGPAMSPLTGEPPGVVTNWPPSLLAAMQRWGTTQPKTPCLTALDNSGKPVYTLTYGLYLLLRQVFNSSGVQFKESLVQVALVFPNNDPVMFMVAFYGCLLVELVPVPIEVPLTRKDAGSQQIGFLLGSCGVTLALTTDACQKGLPKAQTGEVVTFKGWPRLLWFVTDGKHLAKPPKDWHPLVRDASNDIAYIEYKTSKEDSTMGIAVSHSAMLAHCHALTQACGYAEAETITNVLDFKRDAGLWHGVLTSVMNRMHVISIPYSLMKVNPLSWIQKVHSYKARVAVVKSRDMHWSLLSQRDQRDISLSSLRMLIVADGANPWSISSCDAFLNVFQARGLRPEVICPCATSSEALTVAIRRPPEMGVPPPGKAVLSMTGLSHSVIRVDSEEKLSVLTVQDVGQVMPGALVCVVRVEGTPYLCKTDEVGEICVGSNTTGIAYYGLPGITKNIFETIPLTAAGVPLTDRHFTRTGLLGFVGPTIPLTAAGVPLTDRHFTRTGLLGFVGPDKLVFVVGKMDGLMVVSGRRHNADDIVATALAVEPMKFVYRGRIAVFSLAVLHDERVVVVAEQRPDASEEDSFQWMSRILQAIDSIHQVGVYCLALVPANTLPKAPLGGIHISETKQRFLEGALHPCNVLMCPHTCVTNLPKPRQKQPEVGPASVVVGNLVAGKRIAQACGRDVAALEDNDQARKFLYMQDVLQWRAQATPDHPLFLLLNAKGTVASTATCLQLHKRAERVALGLMEKGRLNTGDHVALVYPPGVDLIATFYGCLYAGCVPVTVRPPHPQNLATTLPTVRMIVEVSKSVCILTTQAIMKLLKSKEASAAVDVKSWPIILDTDDLPRKKPLQIYKPPTPEMLAYLDFSVSTTGILAGVKMSHAATSALCRSIKLQCELYPSRQIAICLDPYCGLGFALWCLCRYDAVQELPALQFSQFKVRVTFCSYSVMEMCTKGLGTQTDALRVKGVNLSCVRTCMVVAEERPRIALTQSFSKLFKDLGLSARAVSTTFGCRINVAVCLQGTAGPDPTTVYLDMRALRHDRYCAPPEVQTRASLLIADGKQILPGVRVIIANTETKGPLGDSHLGEIWVSSPHNATGYYTVYGEEALHADHFSTKLSFGDTATVWARSGYLGFLRRTDLTDASGERHDALYVVGSLNETLELRGMRYHPIDIETSVIRAHKSIAECAVFTWTNLLVVVVELDGSEQEALDLVPLVTNVVLEEHYLIVGVVVVVDPGVIPINSRGEKQRMHLRDGFLADQLDPIYVAYNM